MILPNSARNRLIGIAVASAAYLCFAVLDSTAKWLVRSLPVLEIVWLRFVGQVLLMVPLIVRSGDLRAARVRRPGLQAIRACMMLSMTGLNFWALQTLQLAETGAIMFTVPILVALVGAWLLGERLDAGRWAAVVVGFVGVLLVMRPGTQGFQPAMLLSVANAIVYALFTLLTRRLAATDPPAVTNLLSACGAVLLLAPFALRAWQWPEDALQWAAIVLTGCAGGFGHLMLAHAFRFAPASTLAPFMYLQIVYMMGLGYLLFGDVPGGPVFAGAAVVIGSGLYLILRERRQAIEERAAAGDAGGRG